MLTRGFNVDSLIGVCMIDMKFRAPIQVPYKLVPSPAHLQALVPGRRKAIEVRIFTSTLSFLG